ncbi:MAG: hypothetical protein ACKO3N_13730 [Verrucomicrobiota bacterium]
MDPIPIQGKVRGPEPLARRLVCDPSRPCGQMGSEGILFEVSSGGAAQEEVEEIPRRKVQAAGARFGEVGVEPEGEGHVQQIEETADLGRESNGLDEGGL